MRWESPKNPVFLRMLLANTLCLAASVMFLMLPAYLESKGLLRWQIGVADGCFWCISVFLQPFLGPRLDRDGRKRYLLLGSFLMSASAAAYLFIPIEPLEVMLLRTAQGAGFTLYLTASWTWLADHVPHEKVGTFFGIFGITSLMGGLIGPGLSGYIWDHYGYELVFQVASATLGAAFLLLFTLDDQLPDRHPEEKEAGFFSLLSSRPMRAVSLGSLSFGLAIGPLFAFAAAYMNTLHITRTAGACLFAVITLASAGGRIYSARLMDRWGPAAIVLPSLAMLALGCFGLASLVLVPDLVLPMGLGAGVVAGLGYGAVYPALNAMAIQRLPESARGRAVSLATASIDLGSSTGAAVAGIVAQQTSYPTMFAAMGGAVLAVAAFFRITEM